MIQWLIDFVADEFLVVTLPRVLVLRNRRLGLFYKIVQLIGFGFIGLYSVHARTFMVENTVEAWTVNLWREDNPSQTAAAAAAGHAAHPCQQDPLSYTSKTDGQFSYAPTLCKALPNEEAHFNDQSKLFLATLVDDVLFWDGTGETCGAASKDACQQHADAIYEEADGRCSCRFHEQFIVKDAEEQLIRFAYGYEVDLSLGKRIDMHRGGILSSEASDASALVTRFLAPDGADCTFGGKSEWQQSDSVGGISGTLSELLACAGVTLDSDPNKLVSGTLPSSPQHLRTMGFQLALHMHLQQDYFGHVTIEVRVEATPVTTIAWNDAIQSSVSSSMGTVTRRLRRAHGVALSVHVRGSMFTFSWMQLVRGFVDMLVLLQIPSYVVRFVAMYLMGVTSEIYRGTARTKLRIFGKFHNLVAKLMLAEVAFRGLVNDFSSSIEDLENLTPDLLLTRLMDVFMDVCQSGKLMPEEVVRMACVVFVTMDTDKSGLIGCREFIAACTDDGEITMQRMARYFHKDETALKSLRMVLDDTHLVVDRTASPSSFFRSMSSALRDIDTPQPQKLKVDVDAMINYVERESDLDAIVKRATEKSTGHSVGSKQELDHAHDDLQRVVNRSDNVQHAVDRLQHVVANLEDRLRAQEVHCEQALGQLRDVVDKHCSPGVAQDAERSFACPMATPRDRHSAAASRDAASASGSCGQKSPAGKSPRSRLSRWSRRVQSDSSGSILVPNRNVNLHLPSLS